MGSLNLILGIIVGLFILMFLVIVHEFGHFIMARRNGVKVNEFGIGFPPRAIAWVKKTVETKDADNNTITKEKWVKIPKSEWDKSQDSLIFSINWLPIGGFCSMDGESDSDTRKGTFGAASFAAKTKILFGGVAMNWLVAIVILTILALTGMPQFLDNQFNIPSDATRIGGGVSVADVVADSPAQAAGFQNGDKIIKAGDVEIVYPSDITSYGKSHAGEKVTYIVEREGVGEQALVATLNEEDAEYSLGIEMSYGQSYVRSTWSAPIVGIGTTLQLTTETFKGLGEMIWNLISGVARQFSFDSSVREEGQQAIGTAGDAVSGPVGIVGVIFPAFTTMGLPSLAFLAALISVSLACMNVLPIPALDGGRWLLIAIYKLRKKKLTKETEEKIVSRAFMVLILLIVLVTILDISRL